MLLQEEQQQRRLKEEQDEEEQEAREEEAAAAAAAPPCAADASPALGKPAPPAPARSPPPETRRSRAESEEDAMVLDGCRVFLTGTSGAAERRGLLAALRQGGATLERALLPGNAVTHAVVGELVFF
jgi:hypothetical protein